MKKKIKIILIVFILVVIIILKFYKSNRKEFNDIIIYSLWQEVGNKYVLNPKKDQSIKIDIFQESQNKVHKKIAPGSSGKFVVKLIKSKENKCSIELKENTIKPQNLIFIIDNQIYNTLEQAKEKIIYELIQKNQVTINWKWNYETNEIYDIQDTKDGENANTYVFEIRAFME